MKKNTLKVMMIAAAFSLFSTLSLLSTTSNERHQISVQTAHADPSDEAETYESKTEYETTDSWSVPTSDPKICTIWARTIKGTLCTGTGKVTCMPDASVSIEQLGTGLC